MDDEAQKRNTDCVYFLASPLTCKKGSDCEYRHSEAARVNPRDCWYWLSGNCLNASCSFRHPPLDGRPAAPSSVSSQIAGGSSAATSTTAAAPSVLSTSSTVSTPPTASKSTVPCFFFSQGYCAKGGKCPFSHGPPTQYRKEATTYQRAQAMEHPVNGEGNGVSHAKQQFQDRKPASQVKASVRAVQSSQEAGYVPSNVYKLSVSGAPVPPGKRPSSLAGERVDQSSQVARSKPVQNTGDTSQWVESRMSQAHYTNECMEQFPSNEKGAIKAQLPHPDSGRTTRQGRQINANYIARTNETLISSEVQDLVDEVEGQQGSARELHAGDLRNHLKRKKNDPVYLGQSKDFYGKEFSKDRPETARLASRAVPVTEMKDFAPNSNKRAKQDKESSTFSGPKTLAQIKAEKARVAVEGSLKAADAVDDCRSVQSDPGEGREVVELASELQEHCKESASDDLGMSGEETKSEFKEVACSVAPELGETSQNLRHVVGINSSNGLASNSVLRGSKEAHPTAYGSSEVNYSFISGVRENSRNEEEIEGNRPAYEPVDGRQGSRAVIDYVSADGVVEVGSEALENAADTEYTLDYDEEDDFARKLGSYIS